MPRRESAKLIAVAAGCLVIGLALPTAASDTQRARLAGGNADTVDGKHAVGAGASVTRRRGKLVATSGTTGRLPNNIIATAPDSARLGGYTHMQTRSMPLLVQGGLPQGGAGLSVDGSMQLPVGSSGSWSFVLPPDYRAGDPVRADLIFENVNGGPCANAIHVAGQSGPTSTGKTNLVNHWRATGDSTTGPVNFPSGSMAIAKKTVTWLSSDTRPGQFLSLVITHDGGAADTCPTGPDVRGLQIRY